MDFSTTRIENLEQAKSYFQAMGCSGFHMCREYPERYEEYRRLGIDKDLERRWTEESADELAARLLDRATAVGELWHLHSSLESLVRQLKTDRAVGEILRVTEGILPRLTGRSRMLVAETIIGRAQIAHRSGLIFLAYDLGEEVKAQRFAEISVDLLRSAQAGAETKRCESALYTCSEIGEMLGLVGFSRLE